MTDNSKYDIPEEQGINHEETDLDLPDLPGDWAWGAVNHSSMTHKVNVFFGLNITDVDGWYGEIDNYSVNGEEKWDVHVRALVEAPPTTHGCLPRATAETCEQFDTLAEAIESVPDHIATHYEPE